MSLKKILSLKKTRVLAIILILIIIIFIIYTFFYFNSGNKKLTDDEKQVIMNNIKNNSDIEQRIKYINGIIKHNDEKAFVFELCNSYLEQKNPEKARAELLKRAKSSKKTIIERYDYISYFIGISLDYNLQITDNNVKLIKSIDKKLFNYLDKQKNNIEKKISKLSTDLKKQKENSSKFYSINKKIQLLLQEKDQISIYSMDPFQLERMMGDYYYKMKEPELALYCIKNFTVILINLYPILQFNHYGTIYNFFLIIKKLIKLYYIRVFYVIYRHIFLMTYISWQIFYLFIRTNYHHYLH